MSRSTGQAARILRRGCALMLAVGAMGAAVRAAGGLRPLQALGGLAQNTAFTLSVLQLQLPTVGERALSPTQRLVLGQSPLLLAGIAPTDARPQSDTPPAEQPGEDSAESPILSEQADNSVVAKTMGVSSGVNYLRAGDLYVANRAQKQVDAAALAGQKPDFSLTDGPQILILHSHGSEAYTPRGEEDTYLPSDPYRTTDLGHNVVRVGEEMAQVFRTAGFSVIHDTNLYDYPSYNGAYDRSLEATQRWLTQFPTLKVILDVHRDALGDEQTVYKAVSQQGKETAAQVMLVVGTDNGGFHPLWQENLSFALQLQRHMLDDHGTLARPIVLRSSRFNQQLSVGSVLVEVGSHGNTLDEALLGARLFAQSAVEVLTPLRAD